MREVGRGKGEGMYPLSRGISVFQRNMLVQQQQQQQPPQQHQQAMTLVDRHGTQQPCSSSGRHVQLGHPQFEAHASNPTPSRRSQDLTQRWAHGVRG
jgi:hypothetical protein